MQLLLRFSFCAWVSLTLVSCDTANSAATLLASPLGLISRTLGSLGRVAGTSASVDNPDSSSNAVAERGKLIEERGNSATPPQPTTETTVAQR